MYSATIGINANHAPREPLNNEAQKAIAIAAATSPRRPSEALVSNSLGNSITAIASAMPPK
jgi:hypothetical protein